MRRTDRFLAGLELLEGRALLAAAATSIALLPVPHVLFPPFTGGATAPSIAGTGSDQTAGAGVPTGGATVTADDNMAGSVVGHGYDLTATAGVSTLLWETGTFDIPPSIGAGDTLTATIDWGDGTPDSSGWPSNGTGEITYSGQHIYTAAGTYTYTVTLLDDGAAIGSATGTYTVAAAVNSGVAQGQGVNQTATAGVDTSFSPLASFTMPASMYEAVPSSITVDWGDGSSPSYATSSVWGLQGGQATEAIGADHAFAAPGTYTYTVTYANMESGVILGTATGTIVVSAADTTQGGGQGTIPPQQPVQPIGVTLPIGVADPIPIDPIDTVHPIAVVAPIFFGPPIQFSPFGPAPGVPTDQPAAPTTTNLFSTGLPTATTPTPSFSAPMPASLLGAWAAEFDTIFDELSTGLYAVPPSSIFTRANAAPQNSSTLMVDPFRPDANYWDAGLDLLAT